MKFLVFFWVMLLFTLAFRFYFFYTSQTRYKPGDTIALKTRLLSEPYRSFRYQRIAINSGFQRIFVYAPIFPEFSYGDFLQISGTLKSRVTIKENHDLVVYFPKITAIKQEENIAGDLVNSLLAVASSFRQKEIALFKSWLPFNSSSLLLGIVFGIRESFGVDFKEALQTGGVLHVIAASGMNITLLAGFVTNIGIFFLKRQIVSVVCIAIIVFYALVSGFEASIMRASLMGILLCVAQILGRQYIAIYGLGIAGFFMLLISPLLLFDIGFQLSFFSTLGLLYIRPLLHLHKQLAFVIKKSFIGDDVATTLSAQIATLPLMFGYFGSYSLTSILVNALVLWTIPPLMILGGIGGIVGLLFPLVGTVIIFLSLPLLMYFETVVFFLSQFSWSLSFDIFPWQLGLGYYLFLISIILFVKKR